VFHYVSGTAAARDIQELMALADEAMAYVSDRLGSEPDQARLDVYLIDRVLGHGGFAGDALIISYLDRFYAGGDWALVLRHEGTHILDRRFAQTRPALLAEGLAVHVAGGHFRAEPLHERAAALLALDRYIPLAELADSFYPSQHEIGYLEAGSFVGFLIDRFGWEAFKDLYGDIAGDAGSPSAMIDMALQDHLGLTLAQAESDWLAELQSMPASSSQSTDLQQTIDFYEAVRRYQRAFDSTAYFLEAWLPPLEEAERRGITADFVRHPTELLNVTLETMFVAADRAIDQGDHAQAEALLSAVDAVLDAGGDLEASSLASHYRTLVELSSSAGYQAQQIELDLERDVARVLAASDPGAELVELTFTQQSGTWRIASWGN
jgi:hypothetical protein